MTKLDPYIALARAEGVLRRYPRFKAFCHLHKFTPTYLADMEIELELRRDAEERTRRVMKRMGTTVGTQIMALMSEEMGNGKEPKHEHAEESQTGGGSEGLDTLEAETSSGCEDEEGAEGVEQGGEGEATTGVG